MGDVALLVQEIHQLLERRKSVEAQALLDRITDNTAALEELIYLQAWITAEQQQWETTLQLAHKLPIFRSKNHREGLLTSGTVRSRRPMCLLMLGEMARELGYHEEAMEHLQHSLALLNERRMNIPEVRLLVHVSLGNLALELNQTAQALYQYETAHHLCQNESDGSALHATVLTDLCETLTRQEQFEQALAIGKQALDFLQPETSPEQREHLLVLLSRASSALEDCTAALAYAQDASNTASQSQNPTRRAYTLLVLADIQQKGCHPQEARANCEQALALLEPTPPLPLKGNAFFLLGKIAEDEWHQNPPQEAFASEAQAYYEQAQMLFEELCDTASLVRLSTRLAQFLEVRGNLALALTHWKKAFQLSCLDPIFAQRSGSVLGQLESREE